jgi:NitT/TauT family transport system substrate-binding protein
MPNLTTSRIFILLVVGLAISGCDYIDNMFAERATANPETEQLPVLRLAVAPYPAWMPWYLAAEEGVFEEQKSRFNLDINLVSGEYPDMIRRFINHEVQAIAITNVDAVSNLIREDIEADVIMIMGHSNGNETVLIPRDVGNRDLRGKTVALTRGSANHYLFERFLIKNQIDFNDINVQTNADIDLPAVFVSGAVQAVATANPNANQLVQEQNAINIFDSRRIPNEIMYFLVVKRDVLLDHPNFGYALLSAWFAVVERLHGAQRASTARAMARLAGIDSEHFAEQINKVVINDTPIKSLSAIRNDRTMREAMRHIRYFVERHDLVGNEPYGGWVSYPGRTPALLHFNAAPLQAYANRVL